MDEQPTLRPEDATVAVITALPVEQVAAEAALGCQKAMVNHPRATFPVAVGRVKGASGEPHVVVVTMLSGMGTTLAASRCNDLIHVCPRLRYVIMVGIAGAVPNPAKPDDHVRLGDVVVSGDGGVTQFDFGKQEGEEFNCRSTAKAPGIHLLAAVRELQVRELQSQRPWESLIARLLQDPLKEATWARPPDSEDVLHDEGSATPVQHPTTAGRRAGQPKVFVDRIGTSNGVIKSAARREALRIKHGFKAIEMEGAGVAEVCHSKNLQYLVVRGTCDYCNGKKNDLWQPYAAVIAACYCRSILETLPGTSAEASPLPAFTPQVEVAIAGLSTGEPRGSAGSVATVPKCEQKEAPQLGNVNTRVQITAPIAIPLPTDIPSEPVNSVTIVPEPSLPAQPASSRESIDREGRRYLDQLSGMRTNLEIEAGCRLADAEVLPWCGRYKGTLESGLFHSIVEEVVLLETIRAMDAAGTKGKPDLSKAKAALARFRQ